METQWERFSARAGQTIRDLGGEDAIELTNGDATHTAGEGWDYSYPDSPDATFDAETAHPSAVSAIDDGGTFEDIDQLAWVQATFRDQTYTSDTTIVAGEIVTFGTVTVESGVTLTVEGTLQAEVVTGDGTVTGSGEVVTFEDLETFIVPYGVEQEPPTRVDVLENGETFEVQSTVQSGDGYVRLDLVEL
jgi:hypothetical protein